MNYAFYDMFKSKMVGFQYPRKYKDRQTAVIERDISSFKTSCICLDYCPYVTWHLATQEERDTILTKQTDTYSDIQGVYSDYIN